MLGTYFLKNSVKLQNHYYCWLFCNKSQENFGTKLHYLEYFCKLHITFDLQNKNCEKSKVGLQISV